MIERANFIIRGQGDPQRDQLLGFGVQLAVLEALPRKRMICLGRPGNGGSVGVDLIFICSYFLTDK
ncbi:hypothetical protein D1872_283170 [compost metagenome]